MLSVSKLKLLTASKQNLTMCPTSRSPGCRTTSSRRSKQRYLGECARLLRIHGRLHLRCQRRSWFSLLVRATLTPTGLRVLAKYASELIPRITASEIEDKSKADSVAKLLLCTQIFWFFLQCITRLAQGLSMSLLELNTLAHATCALFVYTQ
jgi:hypothetical protein